MDHSIVLKTDGQHIAGHDVDRIIKVNTHGIFSTFLPEFLSDVAGVSVITSRTLTDLIRKWDDYVVAFVNSRQVSSKVIAYHLSFYPRTRVRHPSMTFYVGVYNEVITELNGNRTYTYRSADSSIPKQFYPRQGSLYWDTVDNKPSMNIVEWTGELEDFFLEQVNDFIDMVTSAEIRIDGFDNLMNSLDAGVRIFRNVDDIIHAVAYAAVKTNELPTTMAKGEVR